jgi:hypothetical protein
MISTNYTNYLNRKTEIKTTDCLRIISDLLSKNSDVANRITKASNHANTVQSRLNIPKQHEVSVGVMAVLFCHSRIYGKVPFRRLMLKMDLIDLLNPLIVEDFIYLLNNKYINLEKSVENIEYISITDKLFRQLYKHMTDENRKLFMLLAGRQLNQQQLKHFKSMLFNQDLDIGELFLTAVSCRQLEAAKEIINFGWDMNREQEIMGQELFVCANYNTSKFCVDFYLSHGLKITQALIDEMLKIAEENWEDFDYENTLKLVEELKLKTTEE